MSKKIGFIGCGNMAQAMIGGVIKAGVKGKDITVSDLNEEMLSKAEKDYGVGVTTSNIQAAEGADILILAVKPNLYGIVIEQIRDHVREGVIIVTIAAGKGIESTERSFGKDMKIVRVMPNTPSLVGEGMSSLCPNSLMTPGELGEVTAIFESFGRTELVDERLMDVVTSVSGSAPAYVYMFIEAMADRAVLNGIKPIRWQLRRY